MTLQEKLKENMVCDIKLTLPQQCAQNTCKHEQREAFTCLYLNCEQDLQTRLRGQQHFHQLIEFHDNHQGLHERQLELLAGATAFPSSRPPPLHPYSFPWQLNHRQRGLADI